MTAAFIVMSLVALLFIGISFKQDMKIAGLKGERDGWMMNFHDLKQSADRLGIALIGAQKREKKLLEQIAGGEIPFGLVDNDPPPPPRMQPDQFLEAVYRLHHSSEVRSITLHRHDWLKLQYHLDQKGSLISDRGPGIGSRDQIRICGIEIKK